MSEPTPSAAEPYPRPEPPQRAARWAWLGLILVSLAMFAAAAGFYLHSRSRKNCDDLKTATAVTFSYQVNGQPKSMEIIDPAEVRDLMATLEVTKVQLGVQMGLKTICVVGLTREDGKKETLMLVSAQHIDRAGWGQVYITRAFYERLCQRASKVEGRPIDVLLPNK